MSERRAIIAGAGIGLLAALAAMQSPAMDYDLANMVPYRRPQFQPQRVSPAEQRRRMRAAKMEALAAQPVSLKHMHAAARRRALAPTPPEADQ